VAEWDATEDVVKVEVDVVDVIDVVEAMTLKPAWLRPLLYPGLLAEA
jgi:hypothetical protein